jgi:AcrR family transcriptional regulator
VQQWSSSLPSGIDVDHLHRLSFVPLLNRGAVRCRMATILCRMVVRKPEQRRLTPHDWAAAALDAIARGGIDAVAVETIAAELGATKGSFYWHFKSRDALVEAALELWERRLTDAVIEKLDREPDPAKRLGTLMEEGIASRPADRVEIALLAHPAHPVAHKAVRRVAKRRIAYIADQLAALGWSTHEARDRAALLYYIYLGHLQMAQTEPVFITTDARRRQVGVAFDALASGESAVRLETSPGDSSQ